MESADNTAFLINPPVSSNLKASSPYTDKITHKLVSIDVATRKYILLNFKVHYEYSKFLPMCPIMKIANFLLEKD